MSRPNVTVVDDDEALARLSAERFVASASAAIATRGSFAVALSGGSTPKTTYALLAAPPFRERIDWGRVHFFWGDERCVGPDDAQSNYRMARETMLAPLGIAERQVFRMRGEDDPAAAASAYRTTIQHELGIAPVLDLVMLGMGPDGHTASLFPGNSPLVDDELLVRAPWVEKFSTYRITLTPRVINAAREVEIATAGSAKADVLAAVFDGAYDPVTHPIQIVAPASGRLTWLIDRAAAAKLR